MMETVDAVECMVAIMFDGLLDEIDHFSVEAHPSIRMACASVCS